MKMVKELEVVQRLSTAKFVDYVCKLTKTICEKPHCRSCDTAKKEMRRIIIEEKMTELTAPIVNEFGDLHPPIDVLMEIVKFMEITKKPIETVKNAFCKAYDLKALDEFTDTDERWREALCIMLAQYRIKDNVNNGD